jgi:hypothetical protein
VLFGLDRRHGPVGSSEANATVFVDENLVMRKLGKTAQQTIRPRQANNNASAPVQSLSNRDQGAFEKLVTPGDRNTRNFGIEVFESERVILNVWPEPLPGVVRVAPDNQSRHLLGERVNQRRALCGMTANHKNESPPAIAAKRLPPQFPLAR